MEDWDLKAGDVEEARRQREIDEQIRLHYFLCSYQIRKEYLMPFGRYTLDPDIS